MEMLVEQVMNGLQYSALLFLLAAGLTLILGIMNVVNLAHGSFYMIGAFCAAAAVASTGSFLVAVLAAIVGAGVYGLIVERLIISRLYHRDHLDQVLATLGVSCLPTPWLPWFLAATLRLSQSPISSLARCKLCRGLITPLCVWHLLGLAYWWRWACGFLSSRHG